MGGLLCFGLFAHLIMLISAQNNDTYSDKFIMKTNLSESDVKAVAARNGFELKKKIQMFEQEKYLKRYKRQALKTTSAMVTDRMAPKAISKSFTITDDHWKDMWYLHKDQLPSMGIYEAWTRGFTGSGVTVAFLDDGVETKHSDLRANLRLDLSYNYIDDTMSPEHSPEDEDDGHGTNCAGIVSAVKNDYCVLGVAYNTSFAAVRILGNTLIPESAEAMALIHELDSVDIYSNSWGVNDDGKTTEEPTDIVKAALAKGVLDGRGGKGAIYVWASGNGRLYDDDCNCDGYVNSIYTIAISSLSNLRKPAWYSAPCTAVMATTYGGDAPNPRIVTTNRYNTCTTKFQGTSASAPVATGIISLTLEANPDLTWRDVMHLIVETSSNTDLIDPEGLTVNGAGRNVSRYTGFGLMNADAMITRAFSWETVPDRFDLRTEITPNPSQSNSPVVSRTRITSSIRYLEHVTVTIGFRVRIRGRAIFYLTSPLGTRCKLLGSRSNDDTIMYQPFNFTFSSVHSWGEDPNGRWKLEMMTSSRAPEEVELLSWVLTIYGTVTDPLRGTPADRVNSAGKSLPSTLCFLNSLILVVTSRIYSH